MFSAAGRCVTMSPEVQKTFLEQFARGGSPISVCHGLGVPLDVFLDLLRDDPTFAAQLVAAHRLRMMTVETALYREALKGSTSAATAFLRNAVCPVGVTDDDMKQASQTTERLSLDELHEHFLAIREDALRIVRSDSSNTTIDPKRSSPEPAALP